MRRIEVAKQIFFVRLKLPVWRWLHRLESGEFEKYLRCSTFVDLRAPYVASARELTTRRPSRVPSRDLWSGKLHLGDDIPVENKKDHGSKPCCLGGNTGEQHRICSLLQADGQVDVSNVRT